MAVLDVLRSYKLQHPDADIKVKRQNNVSLKIRVIDKDFKAKSLIERESAIWTLLETLPEDVQAQITFVLLLAPAEVKKSFANMDFEHPIRSKF